MNEMPVGPEPVLNNDAAPGAPDIAHPHSSPGTELLPCPFCGSTPVTERTGFSLRAMYIYCINDNGCPRPKAIGETEEKAIENWNLRVSPSSAGSEEAPDPDAWMREDGSAATVNPMTAAQWKAFGQEVVPLYTRHLAQGQKVSAERALQTLKFVFDREEDLSQESIDEIALILDDAGICTMTSTEDK